MNNVYWNSASHSGTPLLRLIYVIALLFSSTYSSADIASQIEKNNLSELEAKLSTRSLTKALHIINNDIPALQNKYNVPGVSVAVIDDTKLVWSGGFGVLDSRSKTEVDADTVMEVASLSKPFFTYLVLKWAEEGKFDLDAPLIDYLKQDYLPNEDRDKLITARMVLTHSSGLPNWRAAGNGGTSRSHRWADKIGGPLITGAPMSFSAELGETFVYSGEGFLMLQRAIESQSRLSLSLWTEQRLTQPMGLMNTHFGWHPRYENVAARGHNRNGRVTDQSESRDSDVNELVTSAGSLYSSANDYAQFMIEILKTDRDKPYSLSDDGIRMMLRPSGIKIPGGRPSFMGLGWMLTHDPVGNLIAMHTGNNGDFRALTIIWPELKDGLVILTNGARGNELIDELGDTIFAIEVD